MPQPTHLLLPMWVAAEAGLAAQPAAGDARADASEGAATVVEIAVTRSSSIIRNRRTQGCCSIRSIVNNRSPDGSSSSSDDVRIISSMILGTAGIDYLFESSIVIERPTSSSSNNIGEETSHKGGSRARAIAVARRSTSPQSAERL